MSLETVDKEYIGQVLLSKGFRTWFLYMFRIINGKPFIIEPIHKDMFDLFQDVLDRKVLRYNLNVPPRSAKCLGKGTLIRMFNGSQKPIEQIKVGELVMGDDNTPRKVLNTNTGFEEMFEITLQDGSRFICNKSHILVLRNTEYEQSEKKGHLRHYKTQKIDTISVADYLRTSANYKKRHKMIKTALEYKSQDVLIEPYVLGYWLGDGHSKSARITGSFEDVTELSQYLDKINYKYKSFYFDKRGNNAVTFTIQGLKYGYLKNNLKKYNLINNKHIPECYLLNDKETRFKLFAGLIDSDGSNCKNKNNIEFSNKNETLIDNTMELGRSLGFFVKKREIYVKGARYFKLSIIGDFEKIPCLHKRKIDKSNMKFNRISPLLQYFTIKSLGIGQYYGFELDGNHKFVLGDFTISHNTTLCKYLIAYAYAKNPKCNFIYTSYSQSLLADIANDIIGILEHPVYKAMYPQIDFAVENNQIQPVDEFWRDYFISNDKEKKNIYSTKKIITYAGGVCWFASLGSQLTGVGAGVRGSQEFSGGIIIDDGDKPADIHSEIMREKTHKYFSETLLSRLNDSNAFILNVQQRLHTEDLTGFLSKVYGYKSLVKPLFVDEVLQIPSQYSEERLVEIKKDDAVFSAQYQQEPVPEIGMLIHTDKFKPYDVPPQTFDLLYICCDTAFSEKKSADNSAFMLMGVKGHERYILDLYCKKVDFVNLRKDLKEFYNKALAVYGQYNNFSSIYIEAKASGISLIQQLRSEGLPVQEIYPTVHNNLLKKDEVKDKLTRFYEVQADIESGYVNIPASAPWLKDFIKECLAFTGGKQNSKDDMCFVAGTKIKTLFGSKNIEEIKKGDLIITPLGLRTVECSLKTGEKEVIYNKELNLKGTPNHKILTITNGYSNLQDINNVKECMQWNLKNLIIWKIKSLLFLTEKNIAKWGERESISYLMRNKAQSEKILKDFTLQFGNISISKKFQKVMLFIIKTIIHIIITLIIWNVYHASNIWLYINKIFLNGVIAMRQKNTLMKSETSLKYGIKAKMGENGIKNTLLKLWLKKEKKESVKIADKNLIMCQSKKIQNMTEDGVRNATKNTGSVYIENYKKVKLPVYNLKVNGGVYFANNILVSNCDTLIYCLKVARKNTQTDWEAFARAFS